MKEQGQVTSNSNMGLHKLQRFYYDIEEAEIVCVLFCTGFVV